MIGNDQVPIEATFKWLVKENKDLKQKLDILVPYTKNLELYVKELEKQISVLQSNEEKLKSVTFKPKTFKRALGFIKQAMNIFESSNLLAEDFEETEEEEA